MSCEPLVHEQAVSVGLQGVRQQLMDSVARIQNKKSRLSSGLSIFVGWLHVQAHITCIK